MDRAVLEAYGWTDLDLPCDFILDYEEDEEESKGRKKPWRHRWPDDVRDEVLARLMDLNEKRAQAEALARASAAPTKPKAGRKKKSSGEMLFP